MPKIHCKYDALIDPSELKYHPKNRNKHPEDQIERLAEIIEYQGWRYAIKVSTLSGCVTSGHGRIAAAFKKKWKQVPVVYQDYESSDQEYADVQADNAIASWAELNFAEINTDIPDLGPDLDIKMLGLKNFFLNYSDKEVSSKHDDWSDMPEYDQPDAFGFHKMTIHFVDQEALEQFSRIIKQKITTKTRSIWFPEVKRENLKAKSYE